MDRNAADYQRMLDAQERPVSAAKIKVEIEIDLECVLDCITEACSRITYGVGYWAEVRSSEKQADGTFSPLSVREREPADGQPHVWHSVEDSETLQRGIAVLAKKYPRAFARLVEEGDGPTGDLLIQCALFGEERYA